MSVSFLVVSSCRSESPHSNIDRMEVAFRKTYQGIPSPPRVVCTTTKFANTPISTPPVASMMIIQKLSCWSGQ
jgi:hypothetical protein